MPRLEVGNNLRDTLIVIAVLAVIALLLLK